MGYFNNKTEIVNQLKRNFDKTKSPYFANKVELITGEQPDWSPKDYGEEPIKLDPSYKSKVDELDNLEILSKLNLF